MAKRRGWLTWFKITDSGLLAANSLDASVQVGRASGAGCVCSNIRFLSLSVFVLGRWRVVHATAVCGSLASQIVQRTKKRQNRFASR